MTEMIIITSERSAGWTVRPEGGVLGLQTRDDCPGNGRRG